jgi:hypothetical protein
MRCPTLTVFGRVGLSAVSFVNRLRYWPSAFASGPPHRLLPKGCRSHPSPISPLLLFRRKRKTSIRAVPIAIGREVLSGRLDFFWLLFDQAKSSIRRQQIKTIVSLRSSSNLIRNFHFYYYSAPQELAELCE